MDNLKKIFNNLDTTDLKIMKIGIKVCFIILLIAILLLSLYVCLHNILLYNLGIAIFKLSTYFSIEFIICGIVVDKIKQQME